MPRHVRRCRGRGVRCGSRRAGGRASCSIGVGDARARDFGEQADLVVPPAAPGHRALPEVRVGRVVDDAVPCRPPRAPPPATARGCVPAVDQRMDVRVDRIGRRHDEHARAVGAHLMLIEPDRRKPVVPGELRHVLAFLLREHVHVAVAVVARRTGDRGDGSGLASNGVPRFSLNQSVTMIWPSGLALGTRRKITLSRIFFTAGESSVASRWTSSSAICVAPISVA